ncbi:MAG TPA: glycosyltransferase family 4 protein [Anaerolineae bacterium]
MTRRNTFPQAQTTAPAPSYRVLMLAPTSFFADYGCHVRILEEAQILQTLGQQVTIATYHNGGPVPGLDIRRGLPVPWRRDYEVGSSRHKVGLDALLGLKTFQLLLGGHFDVIHAHLHEGALIGQVLGRLFGVPLVFDFQGSMTAEMLDHHFISDGSRLYRPLRRLETWIDRTAPLTFTSSSHAERLLLEEFGCDPGRIHPLPDCVNTEVFRPASTYHPAELANLRVSLGIPDGRKLIVYLGLLAEYQGTGLLLQALQRIVHQRQDVHLLLMGFPQVEYYHRQAEELGIAGHVTFTGRVPYQHAPIYLALGDAAAAPKLSLTEGSGKLLNYMAVGLPTVAFDTPVAREYLGSDGLLATRGDVDSLAANLLKCLFPPENDPELFVRLGARLRARAGQEFGWEKAGQKIIAAYRFVRGDGSRDETPIEDESRPNLRVTQKPASTRAPH